MRSPSTADAESGFSLVEVLVALVVILPAAVAAAGMVTVAVALARDARLESLAVVLASQKLEQLRSLEWSADDLGLGTPATDTTTDLTSDPPGPGGVGLTASPAGSLSSNTPGFVDFLDAAGSWAGTGIQPPPHAVFVRRWMVQPLPASPGDTLVLQVLVTPVARPVVGTTSKARRAGEALLATVRTRTSR